MNWFKKVVLSIWRRLVIDPIVKEVIASLPNMYAATQLSPALAPLLEYTPHPIVPGSYLVRYQKDGGHSQHTVEVPEHLSHLQVADFLITHPAAHL